MHAMLPRALQRKGNTGQELLGSNTGMQNLVLPGLCLHCYQPKGFHRRGSILNVGAASTGRNAWITAAER